jgi:hypothetical protein
MYRLTAVQKSEAAVISKAAFWVRCTEVLAARRAGAAVASPLQSAGAAARVLI